MRAVTWVSPWAGGTPWVFPQRVLTQPPSLSLHPFSNHPPALHGAGTPLSPPPRNLSALLDPLTPCRWRGDYGGKKQLWFPANYVEEIVGSQAQEQDEAVSAISLGPWERGHWEAPWSLDQVQTLFLRLGDAHNPAPAWIPIQRLGDALGPDPAQTLIQRLGNAYSPVPAQTLTQRLGNALGPDPVQTLILRLEDCSWL